MHRIVMIFLAAAAAAVLSSACSIFSGEKQPPGPDLSKMTPKERADYEAFVNARQRFYEKKYKAQKSGAASRKDAQFTDQTGAQTSAQTSAQTTDQPAAQAADQAAAQPTAPEDKKRKRYSVEKRERLSDMTRPVLLQDSEKSIFSWKENSGRRSESLHEKQEAGRSSAFGY